MRIVEAEEALISAFDTWISGPVNELFLDERGQPLLFPIGFRNMVEPWSIALAGSEFISYVDSTPRHPQKRLSCGLTGSGNRRLRRGQRNHGGLLVGCGTLISRFGAPFAPR